MKTISVILLAIFVLSFLVGDIDLASVLIAFVSLVSAIGFWKASEKMERVERIYEEITKNNKREREREE